MMVGRPAAKARETPEAQVGPAAHETSRRVHRGVPRRPLGPRILIGVRAGLVTATPAGESELAPVGRRRLARPRALTRPRVLAVGPALHELSVMTAKERVQVERKAVAGRRQADLGARLPRVGMTRTAPGRRVARPERDPAATQTTAIAAVPDDVTRAAGGWIGTAL
jgi:hypothetical protein